MRCVIETGEFVEFQPPANECGLEIPPMDPRILFNEQSTSSISRSFQVAEGECALLTAYATCSCSIRVEKLLFSRPTGPLQAGGSCACDVPVVAPELLAATNICKWCLGECAEIRHICVPGIYRLVLDETAVGCAIVTMERVSKADTPIPAGLVFGA